MRRRLMAFLWHALPQTVQALWARVRVRTGVARCGLVLLACLAPWLACPALAASTLPLLSWSMDEPEWTGGADEVRDGSGNGLHGTALGPRTRSFDPALDLVDGQGSCGYGRFNGWVYGTERLVRADSSLLDLNNEFTIGIWVKPRAYPEAPSADLHTVLSKGSNYEIHIRTNGLVEWRWEDPIIRRLTSAEKLPLNQWTHVLIRYTPNEQSIYLNGKYSFGVKLVGGLPVINDTALTVGNYGSGGSRSFVGDLDELRIYDRALSTEEIAALPFERHVCEVQSQCVNDNFNRSALGMDWRVGRTNSDYTPGIVGNHLVLTSARNDNATFSTLLWPLPTRSLVEVEFNHYAYSKYANDRGGEGMALVFSDAAVSSRSGGPGPALAYAPGSGLPGFAGGWLGVGIDDLGDYSAILGGVGKRQDSVAVRGSAPGYLYQRGTDTLNPGVDYEPITSTPSPGHRYRVTFDTRSSGRALVSVARDSGMGMQTLIEPYDALKQSGQMALPQELLLSFSGATGATTLLHEVDDLQICISAEPPAQFDHSEFTYAQQALTCNPQPVIIRACQNADCSNFYSDPVSLSLNPPEYWTVDAPASVSGNTISFTGGTAQAYLRVPTAGSVNLVVSNSFPTPANPPVCSTSGCQIDYAASGLLLHVPNLIAGKPTPATISAVRSSDNALECVPTFANVQRNVLFTGNYLSPLSGSQPVRINDTPIAAPTTAVNLSFDETGTAPLSVRYDDAGQMSLDALYVGGETTGDVGQNLVGSDSFVSKPYGLLLQTDTSAACTADINCPLYPGGGRAGDLFNLRLKAVGWQRDGEALTAAALADNLVTTNFQLGDIVLSSTLQAPAGGSNGILSKTRYNHALGSQTTVSQSISEVGVFTLTAMPPAGGYFGETVNGGNSGPVGRFIPAYLDAFGSAKLTPSCGSAFSYQGQSIGFAPGSAPSLTVTAYNRAGQVTGNYDRGAFWRLSQPEKGDYTSVVGHANLDLRLVSLGPEESTAEGVGDGNGAQTYNWFDEQLLYQAAAQPGSDDYPFSASIQLSFAASTLTDLDGACRNKAGGACEGAGGKFAGSWVRLGRLRIGNAHGSELQSLSLPVHLESWQDIAGGSFQTEGLDTCTALGDPVLDTFTGNLASGETVPAVLGPLAGIGELRLSAPGAGNDGSVQASLPASPTWLQYPWDGVSPQFARGLGSFGIYKGSEPLIFRRESYR